MKPNKNGTWWGVYNANFTKWYQFRGNKLVWVIG